MHQGQACQHCGWQHHGGNQRTADVQQEQYHDQGHCQHLFPQRRDQGIDRAVDQVRAIIGGGNRNARRKCRFERIQTFFDALNGSAGIFAVAHDYHPANGLTLAIPVHHALTDLRSDIDIRDLREQQRIAVAIASQRYLSKIVQHLLGAQSHLRNAIAIERRQRQVVAVAEVATGTNHVLAFADFNRAGTGFGIGGAHSLRDILKAQVVRQQRQRIDRDVVLFFKSTDRGNFADAANCGQFKSQEPVL